MKNLVLAALLMTSPLSATFELDECTAESSDEEFVVVAQQLELKDVACGPDEPMKRRIFDWELAMHNAAVLLCQKIKALDHSKKFTD